MSDRTPSSVRTGSREDAGAKTDDAAAEPVPTTSTQAIPTTGSQRAQGPTTGSQRAQGPATGSSAAASPAAAPSGTPAGGAPVPPATGPATVPPPATTAPGAVPAAVPPPAPAAPAAADAPAAGRIRGRGTAKSRGPRRARLQLRHIDTWSALKISLVLSIALFFIWMVAVAVLYGVLSGLGVFNTINDLFGQLGSTSGNGHGGGDVITPGVVFWGAAVIGAINVVLLTALCTVGTFIYNLCSDLVGGLELTLSERD